MQYPAYTHGQYVIVVVPSNHFLFNFDAVIYNKAGLRLDWLGDMTEEAALAKAVSFIDNGLLTNPNKPPNTGTPPIIGDLGPFF